MRQWHCSSTDACDTHLHVCGGYWIARTVWVREGIQKSIQRTLHELNKRLLDGILLAAAQNTVLQNMWDALAIVNWSTQDSTKGFILVLVDDRDHFGTCSQQPVERSQPSINLGR